MKSITTVGELVDYLDTHPRDRKIVMASDAEGNGFSPLATAGEGMYAAISTWHGDVYITPEEDAAPDDAVRVVVLVPTN